MHAPVRDDMMRSPCLFALLAALLAAPAEAETLAEAWVDFDADQTLYAEPAARQLQARIDEINRRDFDVGAAIDSGRVPSDAIGERLGNDPRLRAMAQAPEWLHGMDLLTSGRPTDRLEPAEKAERPAITIWIAGWDGLILRSEDEGVHFTRQETGTTAALMTIDFLDPVTGVAAGVDGAVVRTDDGGATWSRAGPTPGDHLAVDCTGDGVCLLGGAYSFLYRSANAGRDWVRSGRLAWSSTTTGLAWLAPGTAVATGRDGIWRTSDGGATWSRVFDLATGGALEREDRMRAVDSPDGQSVWAVGHAAGHVVILRSRDAGLTWEDESRSIAAPGLPPEATEAAFALMANAVSAADAAHVVIAGVDGHMLATADGGDHWWMVVYGSGPEESLYALEMRDRRVGWAAGNYGQVRGTNAGWREWARLRGLLFEMIMTASDFVYEWEAR
jgi:photosystem II stability/assembly factor-like uncharacterized protein